MEIRGIEHLTGEDLEREIEAGGKFVLYTYTVSIVVMTFRRPSAIHFVRGGESRVAKGLGCTLATALLGWWGIPWGPIYSIASLATNLGGGKDVTREVLSALNATPAAKAARASRQADLARQRDVG